MAKFNSIDFLHENRDLVIAKYNEAKNEQFFNGMTLREWMYKVLNLFDKNKISSVSRGKMMLPIFLGQIYVDSISISGNDYMVDKYRNNQQMLALV